MIWLLHRLFNLQFPIDNFKYRPIFYSGLEQNFFFYQTGLATHKRKLSVECEG
jgi:hypothetical protein